MYKNDFFCNNCGLYGHFYKSCHYPIISLGVISFIIQKDDIKFILVKRKDTIGYSDFIRGKYQLNKESIMKLIDIMSLDEKNKICNLNFNELWKDLWRVENSKQEHLIEYNNSQVKYYKLSNILEISNLVSLSKTQYTDREWGFPKGRRDKNENDLKCACREFEEETDLNEDDYDLLEVSPIIEDINGTDNIKYRHIYYLAQLNNTNIKLNPNNSAQIREISEIKLMTYDEITKSLRPYHIDKLKIINSIIESLKFLKLI